MAAIVIHQHRTTNPLAVRLCVSIARQPTGDTQREQRGSRDAPEWIPAADVPATEQQPDDGGHSHQPHSSGHFDDGRECASNLFML